MEQFLKRHNITEDDCMKLVDECCDYDHPYPRSKPIGKYPSAVDTEEEEERITIDYFKNNPALSRGAVMKFVMEYNTGQQPHQSYIDTMKKMTPAQFDLAYWGYKELFNPEKVMNEEKVKEIGAELNRRGNIDLMRVCYYLMSWDIKNAGMLIGSYPRLVEYYWDGIGDWMA